MTIFEVPENIFDHRGSGLCFRTIQSSVNVSLLNSNNSIID